VNNLVPCAWPTLALYKFGDCDYDDSMILGVYLIYTFLVVDVMLLDKGGAIEVLFVSGKQ